MRYLTLLAASAAILCTVTACSSSSSGGNPSSRAPTCDLACTESQISVSPPNPPEDIPTDVPTDDPLVTDAYPTDEFPTDELPSDEFPTDDYAPPADYTYKITGNGKHAMVTYSVGFSIEQDTNARLPWHHAVDSSEQFYQVSAQDADGTSITCQIVDGEGIVLDEHTSSGQYAIASCTTGV